jgi:gamma-glutamyl phosphate reductase
LKNSEWKYDKIAIKVGSNVITQSDRSLNVGRMLRIVEDVAVLTKQGLEVILISSGAVAAGRSSITPSKKMNIVSAKQIWAAIGQVKLMFTDKKAFSALKGKYPPELLHKATKDSFGTEFLSYKMAVKTAGTFEEALAHIEKYGSKHSEAIISENAERISLFFKKVDASSVYSNASTAFTDGAEFGLGAEIGISTQKLHARGPMALEEFTTYKWIIEGNGQVRK